MAIDFVPDINKFPHISDAHKEEKLIIFVGAGLSALWGCKRWKDMAATLVETCYELNHIDYWTRENLLLKYSAYPRKLITIAQKILGEKYVGSLHSTLAISSDRRSKMPKLFENLFALNAAFMTTNIDDHLSSLFDGNNVHVGLEKFTPENIKPKNIFHLHGAVRTPSSLVMSIDEYVTRYRDEQMKKFLEYAFFENNFRLLFIGYGVDEMEIIDYMIEKYSKGPRNLKSLINRFYILLPFFQNEEPLLAYEQLYFQQINMNVVPYAIDSKGYDQLYEVIEIWKRELSTPPSGDDFYKLTRVIESNV